MLILWVILAIAVFVVLYVIAIYNRLIQNRNQVKEGWSGIEVQLKQRANLIPNLIDSVKGYMKHEKTVLTDLTKLRSECLKTDDVAKRAQQENMLSGALRQLFALAENYPELKASENFLELQAALERIENQIQLARRYYNGTVRDFNNIVEMFPSCLVAQFFQFKIADFFEIENPEEREVPQVSFDTEKPSEG